MNDRMPKRVWFGLMILGTLSLLGQGCYLLEEKKPEENYEFIPTKDRIKIPGTAFDRVVLYCDFEAGIPIGRSAGRDQWR